MAGETLSGDLANGGVVGAQNRLTGVSGVSPSTGVDALQKGPQIGVHPDVALQAMPAVSLSADLQAKHDIAASSPHVAKFLNTANDAQVATVQDDLGPLAKIGAAVGQYAAGGGPFQDIADAFGVGWKQLQVDAQRYYATASSPSKVQGFSDVPVAGSLFKDVAALAGAPFAAITEPLAKGEAALPLAMYTNPLFGRSQLLNTPDARLAQARKDVGLAMFGAAAPEGGAAGVAGAEAAATHGPPHVGPDGRWNTTPKGFVADEAGAPVHFADQKAAGVWAMREGYGTGTDQIFSPANATEGRTYHAQETGRTAAPTFGVPTIGVHPGVDAARSAVAEVDAASVANLQSTVAESKTLQNSPATLEQFIAQQTGDRTVTVDPERLIELAHEGHEPFPELSQQIIGAAADGTDVQVPLSRYLTATAGQPFAETLNAATTFRDGGTSVDASKEPAATSTTTIAPSAVAPPADFTPEETARVRTIAADHDAQLQQVVAAQRLNGLFTDAKAVGMSEDQFARYNNHIEEAVGEAQDKLVNRAYKQILRERKPDWQDALKQHTAAAEREIAADPTVAARSYLTNGRGPLGEPVEAPFKLDRADPIAQHGKDLGLPDKMFSRKGISADEAAEVFGFASGADMIRSLDELHKSQGDMSIAEHNKAMAHELATARTREQLGYDLSPDTIYAAASEAVNGPKVESFLASELQHLAKVAGLPFDKAAVKQFALDRFNQMPVKQALNIKQMEGYVYKGGIKAEKALLKGDFATAFIRKQQQFIHHIELAQAHKFAKIYARATKQFTRWAKKPTLPNVAQEYTNYVHAALKEMGYNVKRNDAELLDSLKGVSLPDFINAKQADGAIIVNAPLQSKAPIDHTVEQLNGAWDTLRSLVHNGREEESIVTLGKREDMAQLIAEITDNFNNLGRKFTPNRTERHSIGGTVERNIQGMNAPMIRMEQLLDEADRNDPRGPLNRAVVEPTQVAKGRENDMLARVTKELDAFGKAQPKHWLGTMKAKVNVPELRFNRGEIDEPRITTRGDLVRTALNWGNPSNKLKLLEGYGWDEATVKSILDQHMTKPDWDFVQKIWDIHESLWPEIEKTYRAVAGIPPTKINATAFDTPHGTYAGGYFPLSYDKLRGSNVKSFSKDSIWGEEYGPGLPANPYTNARTGYVGPLALNFDGINAGIGQTIHDIAFREALLQAQKVLMHPEVLSGIQETFGPSYRSQLRPWLEYAARQSLTDDTATDVMANIMRAARVNMTFVGLAYRISSAAIHGSVALSDSVAEVGAADFFGALRDIWITPGQKEYWTKYINENSPEVRNRAVNMDSNVREAVRALSEKQGFLEDVQKFGFHMLAYSDQFSAQPTWLAAFRQETNKGLSPAEAMAVADKRVRQAHGASAPVDVPAIQRGGGGFWHEAGRSTAGMFLSFMNHAYNRLWSIGRQFGRAGEQASEGEWAGARRDFSDAMARSLFYTIVPAIAVTSIHNFQRHKSPKDFTGWIDGIAHTTVGSIPFAGMVLDLVEGREQNTPLGQASTDTAKTLANAWHAAHHDGHVSSKWLQQAINTAGYWTGKIPGQAATSGQYLWDFATGKEHLKDAIDFAREVAFGSAPKKK